MANGDKAAAAGLAVFAASQDARLGYDNDNVRGDELATHLTTGTHAWSKITGTPASFPNADVTAANANATPGRLARYSSVIAAGLGTLSVSAPTGPQHATPKVYVDAHVRDLADLVEQLTERVRELEERS
jgi:hypothetical protein